MGELGDVAAVVRWLLERITAHDASEHAVLLARLREAERDAVETGDTSALERMRDELVSG